MKNLYPILREDEGDIKGWLKEITRWVYEVTRERSIDLDDYNDMDSTRSKIFNLTPASSSDLKGTEKVGDVAADASYLYVVVDNSGTLEWRRVAISSF